jgi:hypothetical protein
MWLIPKTLHISAFVPDTEALTSDLNEQSEIFAQSLIAKSGTSPARTWLARLKRGGWITHLSGRILRPSHGASFGEKWTSSLEGSLVSHLAKQEEKQEMKTQDTFGPTSSEDSESLEDLPLFSSKTSRAYSHQTSKEMIGLTLRTPPFCSMSLESWNDWVIGQRQEYSARLRSALHTNENASIFWVSAQTSQTQEENESLATWFIPYNPNFTPASNSPAERLGPQEEALPLMLGNHQESPPNPQILNPRWVETLMGLPVGWTMPSCTTPLTLAQTSCAFLETEWSQLPPNELSEPYGVVWEILHRDDSEPPKQPATLEKKGGSLLWKTPSTMETEGGIKQVRKNDTAQLKLRDQVAHQGALDYWPPPIDAPPYLPRKTKTDPDDPQGLWGILWTEED